tara:strand:- start:44 stop:646 length:603 start_codon:yes stop_codon:yes gene_type:complete
MKYLIFLSFLLLIQCDKQIEEVNLLNSVESICDGDCWVKLYTEVEPDNNNFYHIERDFDSNNPIRFNVNIESNEMSKSLRYNGVSNIVSNFSSKYHYTIDNIVFTIPLYNPFQSLYTYNGMIKVKDTLISIDYFKGEKYPLVQPTKIYHSKKKKGKWLYSKKIIPLFKEMINDTLVVYSDTSFDGKLHIKDSIKIVIHNN